MKKYVQPADFGGGLLTRAAEEIYAQMEHAGRVEEASVLSHFTDTQDQAQIAGIFHTLDQAASGKDREKAVRETLLKVFAASKTGSRTDLQQMIQRKKLETELRSVKLNL